MVTRERGNVPVPNWTVIVRLSAPNLLEKVIEERVALFGIERDLTARRRIEVRLKGQSSKLK